MVLCRGSLTSNSQSGSLGRSQESRLVFYLDAFDFEDSALTSPLLLHTALPQLAAVVTVMPERYDIEDLSDHNDHEDLEDHNDRHGYDDDAHRDVHDESDFNNQYPVDGKKSCQWHFECITPLKDGVIYCDIHADIVLLGMNSKPTEDWHRFKTAHSQSSVTFHEPTTAKQQQHDLDVLRSLREKDYMLWFVDTEYASIRDAHAIAFQITVRDANTKAIVLSSNIDYNGLSLSEIEEQIRMFLLRHNATSPTTLYQTATYFRRHYGADQTNGLGLGQSAKHSSKPDFTLTHIECCPGMPVKTSM